MTEMDDKLVARFIAEQHTEIADDGFTERVMQRIPMRRKQYDVAWTIFCLTAFVLLFVYFGGWERIEMGFHNWVQSLTLEKVMSMCSWNNILYLAATGALAVALALYKVIETE